MSPFIRRGKRKGTNTECVCLLGVEITFLEGLRKENAVNQIKKKSQAMWELRAEWERERVNIKERCGESQR